MIFINFFTRDKFPII